MEARVKVASCHAIKGSLIEETYAVFRGWDYELSKTENLKRARQENTIGAKSAAWAQNVSWAFSRRFDPAGRDRALAEVPQTEIGQLIAERTSAAVKDALESLLDAPPPVTSRGGGRRASGRGSARRTRSTTGRRCSGTSATPDHAVMDSIKQAIEATSDGASKADVLAATGLTDAQWNAAIAALLADGSVAKSGAGRGTRYHFPDRN